MSAEGGELNHGSSRGMAVESVDDGNVSLDVHFALWLCKRLDRTDLAMQGHFQRFYPCPCIAIIATTEVQGVEFVIPSIEEVI